MLIRLSLVALLALVTACKCPKVQAQEEFDRRVWTDWRNLFDGKSLAGWRNYGSETVSPGWAAQDGTLARVAEGAGNLITTEQFADFDLYFEWKVTPAANSGVFFWVSEDKDGLITAPEYQVLDNAKHPDGKNPKTSAGSNYAVNEPVKAVTKPVGEWNEARITVYRGHVTHVLNGIKVVEYDLGSPQWKSQVASSKFKQMPAYGTRRKGHIALQDHGDAVAFRNIQIRTVKPGAE